MNSDRIAGRTRRRVTAPVHTSRCIFASTILGILVVLCFGQMEANASDNNALEPVTKPVVQAAPNNVQKAIGNAGQACASWLGVLQPPGSAPAVLQEPYEEVCKFVVDPATAQDGYLMTGAMISVAALIPIGFLVGFFWTAFRFGGRLFRRSIASRFDEASWHWRT